VGAERLVRTLTAVTDWADEIRELARQRDAVILAHNYQLPEIQEVAHNVGDSRLADRTEAIRVTTFATPGSGGTGRVAAPGGNVGMGWFGGRRTATRRRPGGRDRRVPARSHRGG
jgi:Quinolinate synthetase A protein